MEKKTILGTTKSVEDQISELQGQISELTKVIAAKASEARDEAGPLIDAAAGGVRSAARTARDRSQQVVETVKENPGTATSVALTAGLLGLAIGYLIASASAPPPSRWRF